jgi:hypothetical protein
MITLNSRSDLIIIIANFIVRVDFVVNFLLSLAILCPHILELSGNEPADFMI